MKEIEMLLITQLKTIIEMQKTIISFQEQQIELEEKIVQEQREQIQRLRVLNNSYSNEAAQMNRELIQSIQRSENLLDKLEKERRSWLPFDINSPVSIIIDPDYDPSV